MILGVLDCGIGADISGGDVSDVIDFMSQILYYPKSQEILDEETRITYLRNISRQMIVNHTMKKCKP